MRWPQMPPQEPRLQPRFSFAVEDEFMDSVTQPGFLFSVLMFLVVLGPLVVIHELGHYWAGRWFGVHAEVFSIGFGRELFGWTDKRGTRWKVAAIPLGGYVKFFGDMNAASQPDPNASGYSAEDRARAFPFKPLWQRAIVVAAGPAANFLFAILIFVGLFLSFGYRETSAIVGAVQPNSAAAEAGFERGDQIVRADGRRITSFERFARIVVINPGQPMEIEILRGSAAKTIIATPRIIEEKDQFGNVSRIGRLGLNFGGQTSSLRDVGLFEAVPLAVRECIDLTRFMADTLWQIVSGARPVTDMGGPVKIAHMSGQVASAGVFALIGFIALISINLGFVNLLPVPMLDGGHLLLYAAEAVRGGKPVSAKVQEWAFMAGFALVMGLTLVLTWNDLASFGVWQRLAGLLS
jgi:regulator of sigma E protease